MKILPRFACLLGLAVCSSWPTTAPAGDATIAQGYASPRDAEAGIVLHLHGCGGLSTQGWVEAWFAHLEKAGFKVYAPNSFAEPRPAASCAIPYPNKAAIYSLRVTQTARAFEMLQRDHPGKPIYIWGHSEGGGLASRLRLAAAGIMTTGYDCGIGLPARLDIQPGVPFLALIGDERIDHWLSEGLSYRKAGSMAELCGRVMQAPNQRWMQFKGMGHIIPIWQPEVLSAVNGLLGIRDRYTGSDAQAETAPAPDIRLAGAARDMFTGKYRTLENSRAFAIGPNGVYGYAFGWSNRVDAKTTALYYCNKFALSRGGGADRRCTLYAVDDEVEFDRP